jgi:hypothetical protein
MTEMGFWTKPYVQFRPFRYSVTSIPDGKQALILRSAPVTKEEMNETYIGIDPPEGPMFKRKSEILKEFSRPMQLVIR